MSQTPEAPQPSRPLLLAAELQLLKQISGGHDWLRAVLCTLARRGVAYRTLRGDAAGAMLDSLATSPIYKAGQFLFDLMEWEDFMLDGPPPPVVPTTFDAASMVRLSRLLDEVRSHLDSAGARGIAMPSIALSGSLTDDSVLPPLEGGYYLYRDVVLGAIASTLPYVQASGPG